MPKFRRIVIPSWSWVKMFSWNTLFLKMTILRGTTHSKTELHISEDLNSKNTAVINWNIVRLYSPYMRIFATLYFESAQKILYFKSRLFPQTKPYDVDRRTRWMQQVLRLSWQPRISHWYATLNSVKFLRKVRSYAPSRAGILLVRIRILGIQSSVIN